MTDGPPLIFDRAALLAHRDRARALPDGAALFLHQAVASEIEERLEEVNRRFTAPVVVTGWPEVWQDRMSGANIVPDTEVLDLTPGTHDLALHVLGLHWAADPVGQIAQCRHALRPDGLLLRWLRRHRLSKWAGVCV